ESRIEQRSHLRRLAGARIGLNLFGELRQYLRAEHHECDAEVLIQVRTAGIRRERLSLGTIGRQQEDLGIAAFDVGAEKRSDAMSVHRPSQNQVTIGEEELRASRGVM